ncbi:glycosyltransferase family 4 protein [Marinomonas agarivorans]|nr:glycosyltransferase family 4 protein [Marinomonas agarivorans]
MKKRIKKIAIIHDWLVVYAGAEKVLEELVAIYPDADLFSIVDFIPADQRQFIANKSVTTSFIQKLPFAKTKYRNYLPLMPLAIEQFDLSDYDLVISSSHAVAKSVITGPDQLHVSYVHSPIRYAWDLQHQYLKETGLDKGLKGWLTRYLLHRIRKWDVGTSNRVDKLIANSNFIKRRIEKVYRRESTVIYPPVSVDDFLLCEEKEDFFLTASRMVPYKKMDLIIQAFKLMPDKKLKIIGNGPDFNKLKKLAENCSNIELLGYQPFKELKYNMQKARAFVFAAEEDFGIIPVEAQACGTPVIAYGKGGVLDTVIDGKTGILFDEQTPESLQLAVEKFMATEFVCKDIRAHACCFSQQVFRTKFADYVALEYERFVEA